MPAVGPGQQVAAAGLVRPIFPGARQVSTKRGQLEFCSTFGNVPGQWDRAFFAIMGRLGSRGTQDT